MVRSRPGERPVRATIQPASSQADNTRHPPTACPLNLPRLRLSSKCRSTAQVACGTCGQRSHLRRRLHQRGSLRRGAAASSQARVQMFRETVRGSLRERAVGLGGRTTKCLERPDLVSIGESHAAVLRYPFARIAVHRPTIRVARRHAHPAAYAQVSAIRRVAVIVPYLRRSQAAARTSLSWQARLVVGHREQRLRRHESPVRRDREQDD